MKLFLLILLIPLLSLATVEVAFIEIKNQAQQIVQFEPNGQFAHIAISYQNQWLHAHPFRGVELISREKLEKMGTVRFIFSISEIESISKNQVDKYLGKPYDQNFSWSEDKIYCSELVAKLLSISPEPMNFESTIWPDRFQNYKGALGISPDDLFKYFMKYGTSRLKFSNQCSMLFE